MVHLGMFAMPIHPPERDYATILREDQEAVILADRLDFSEFYIGEHHTTQLERITNPLIFIASVADKTKNIRLGSGVLNLPQMHPVALASNVAMLDQLTGGRFIMGIGPGSLSSDVEAFGILEMDVRMRMVMESIDFVTKIWTTEPPFELKGEFWNVALQNSLLPQFKVGWPPLPRQRPGPPIVMAMVSAQSSTARLAGAQGWLPMSSNFINKRYLRTQWEGYAEGCESIGRRPDPADWRVVRCCLVTETDAQAEDYLADPTSSLAFYYSFFRYNMATARAALYMLKPDLEMTDDEATIEKIVRGQVISGSPKRVLEQLVALREEIGHFGTLIMTSHDWDRPAMWQRSMQLMATEVMPRFSVHAKAASA